MQSKPKTISFYRRSDNARAKQWEHTVRTWLKRNAPAVGVVKHAPELIIALGGDGTILQAAREYATHNPLLFGVNLGTVGFLASVRQEQNFLKALKKVLAGTYRPVRRMMLDVTVRRSGKTIFQTTALNEAYIQNPLGMVKINVTINKSSIQQVHGTGILVATPTGSTGYNLSAHGPIVDPALECLIVTEILDHNIPTPSIVVPTSDAVILHITAFRKEVILACDGQVSLPLAPGDEVVVQKSQQYITIAEIEPHYFYKSLHEKFSIS